MDAILSVAVFRGRSIKSETVISRDRNNVFPHSTKVDEMDSDAIEKQFSKGDIRSWIG
jgi:hypothetical protein